MKKRVQYALRKQAGAAGDFWRGVVGTSAPAVALAPASPLAAHIAAKIAAQAVQTGGMVGLAGGSSEDKAEIVDALKDLEGKKKYMSYIPGVGAYRLTARQQMLNKLLEDRSNEERSTGSSRTIDKLSILNPINMLAAPFAAIAAGVTPTKKLKEVADAVNDKDYRFNSWLIPGWKVYQDLKALGASDTVSDMKYTEDDLKDLDAETKAVLLKKLKENKKAKKD